MRIISTPFLRQFVWWFVGISAAVLLAACQPGDLPSTAGAMETQIADGVAETLTAAPTLQPTVAPSETPPPTTATPEPTATATVRPTRQVPTPMAPVSTTFPDSSYVLDDEQSISEYAVRVWRNVNSPDDGLGFDRILTLDQTGAPSLAIEFYSGFDPLSGTDITADGVPELIVTTYTGGAHCCFGVTVFSLGDTPTRILETRPSNCGGQFQDLDGDGILEFVTCDDIFAYTYCPYAASPLAQVVLAYAPDTGYVPASPRFADRYAADLPALTAQAEAATPGGLGEWDNTTKCGVLPLVLALLYSGQPEQAWSELARIYTYPDAATFRQEIEQTAGTSQLFTLP